MIAAWAALGSASAAPTAATARMQRRWITLVEPPRALRVSARGGAILPCRAGSAALVDRLARPVLEERAHRALEVLRREEGAPDLGDDRVGGPRAAVGLRADDALGRGMRAGGAARQALGERARGVVEAFVGEHAVDDVPALERRGGVEVAGHDDLAGARRPGALGETLGAAHRRRQTDDGLDEAEAGALGGQQQVARERQL